MRKVGLALVFCVILFSSAHAGENSAVHERITDPKIYIPLREEMTHMEIRFVELELLTAAKPLDYAAMKASLGKMVTSSKKIREVNPDESLKPSLKDLTQNLSALEKEIQGRDSATIRNRLDRLYNACFRCHSTHAPRM